MEAKLYAKRAMRTKPSPEDNERIMERIESLGPEFWHALLGLASEPGEIFTHIKEVIAYGKPLDVEYIKKELGDSMWFITFMCVAVGIDLGEVMEANNEKLMKRFPEKFSAEDALARKDETNEPRTQTPTAVSEEHAERLWFNRIFGPWKPWSVTAEVWPLPLVHPNAPLITEADLDRWVRKGWLETDQIQDQPALRLSPDGRRELRKVLSHELTSPQFDFSEFDGSLMITFEATNTVHWSIQHRSSPEAEKHFCHWKSKGWITHESDEHGTTLVLTTEGVERLKFLALSGGRLFEEGSDQPVASDQS